MSKSGIVIRLIDVVLLLLFGFMVISEMNRKSPIKLPQSLVPIKKEIDPEELFIIGIMADARFYIENEDLYVADFESLKNLILTRQAMYKKLRVRVRSAWNLPIKYTMRIANFCREQNIPTGMDVHSLSD